MNTGTKIQIGVATAIAILSVSTLTYAIIMHETGQTDEPGFMTACFNQQGLAEFDLDVCEHGNLPTGEITWEPSNIPLTVRTSGQEPPSSLIYAMAQINSQAGCTLLVLSDESEADVIVFPNTPMSTGDHPGGSTIFRREGDTQRSYIDIFASSAGSNVLSKIYMHELGHVLGLAHDPWQGSIMRHQQNSSVELVRLTDNDRQILNENYCR